MPIDAFDVFIMFAADVRSVCDS